MTSSTQAINPAAISPLPPQGPPQGMPPSLPPDQSSADQPSDAQMELILRQQLAQAQQAQKQNPFKKALDKSINWLKEHWPIALSGLAVIGLTSYFALTRKKGVNNGGLLSSKGGVFNRIWGETIEDRYKRLSTNLEKYIHEAETATDGPGKISAARQVLEGLWQQQEAHVQAATTVSERDNRLYNQRQLEKIITKKANRLFNKLDEVVQTGGNFDSAYFDREMKEIITQINQIDGVWLNNFGCLFGVMHPPISPPNNNNPQPAPISPSPVNSPNPTPAPTPSPTPARTGFWAWYHEGGFLNPRLW